MAKTKKFDEVDVLFERFKKNSTVFAWVDHPGAQAKHNRQLGQLKRNIKKIVRGTRLADMLEDFAQFSVGM